ncbi:MAG: DegT/DnrJ/EryC1/StrS family aminotransferase [bacterium]
MIPLSKPDITNLERQAVLSVLKTSRLSLGPKLEEFENLMANHINIKYAVAVNSGTSALHLIIRALDIGEGDEVITTPFSFIASSNCILFEKAKPVFVDIDKNNFNIDVNKIETAITKNTKAILAVDVFGYPADWDALQKIAKKYNLFLIEDSAEALGSEYKNKKCGSFGDAGVFAFYPNKQITTGEGGMIVTNNRKIAEFCKSMRNQGRDESGRWFKYVRLGYNYRLSEINCALGIVQLKRINQILKKREKVAQTYNRLLKNFENIKLPYATKNIKISWFVYVVRVQSRDKIMQALQKKGIGCSNYFPPIHLMPFYQKLFNYKKGDFPICEKTSQETLALPFYNNLKKSEINYVVQELKKLI